MSTWLPHAEYHGLIHPTCDAIYFSVEKGIDNLSGFVSPDEFKRLCRHFRVPAKTRQDPATRVSEGAQS